MLGPALQLRAALEPGDPALSLQSSAYLLAFMEP